MYTLGIDLGTTYSAAAVWRGGRAAICGLGTHTAAVPSVVLVRGDGAVLTGEAAARRAATDPDRVAREFKRRLGDTTPMLLGGVPYTAQQLTAELLRALVGAVTEREGGAPGRLAISHPANWGPFKIELLRQAVELAGVRVPVTFVTEPEAAAVSYARQERLAQGETVAVYDLGGGTFDAAVLQRTPAGFAILGHPEGIERLGGIDIDAAVFAHVARSVGAPLADLDEDDVAAVAAAGRLRAECVAAKEALSTDLDTVIPVLLPGFSGEVRLTRAELEAIVRPSLYDSIEALRRALRSASIQPEELAAVLLVGGSSRMPLVAELVSAELGRPVAVDAHPKHAIALGAAWVAGAGSVPADGATALPVTPASGGPLAPVSPGPAGASLVPLPSAPADSPPPFPPFDPIDRSVPQPPTPGGIQILRPAGSPDGAHSAFAPPPPQPAYPVPPALSASLGWTGAPGEGRDESGRDRRAAILGGVIGAEAGLAGIAGFEQGQAAAFSAGSAGSAGSAAGPAGGGPAAAGHPVAGQVFGAPAPAGFPVTGVRKVTTLSAPRSFVVGAAAAVAAAIVVVSAYAALHGKRELILPTGNPGTTPAASSPMAGSATVASGPASLVQQAAAGGGGGAAVVPPPAAHRTDGSVGGGGRTTTSTSRAVTTTSVSKTSPTRTTVSATTPTVSTPTTSTTSPTSTTSATSTTRSTTTSTSSSPRTTTSTPTVTSSVTPTRIRVTPVISPVTRAPGIG
jgi:actin-like ATPase involved in cell morphogenesis